MSKVHVIADETLGGIKREYVEVERKAVEGDILICNQRCDQDGRYYGVGDVGMMLYKSEEYPSIRVKFLKGFGGPSAVASEGRCFVGNDSYRVLEPSDIVIIDDKRYKLVNRKADVGERVIQISDHLGNKGAVFEVTRVLPRGIGFISAPSLSDSEYRVLEPVANEAPPETNDDLIANLVRRVAELERRDLEHREVIESLDVELSDIQYKYSDLFGSVTGIKRDIETWAQEVEALKHASKPQQITIDADVFARLLGGVARD